MACFTCNNIAIHSVPSAVHQWPTTTGKFKSLALYKLLSLFILQFFNIISKWTLVNAYAALNVMRDYRFDCMPDGGTKEKCESRGCCYSPVVSNFSTIRRMCTYKLDINFVYYVFNYTFFQKHVNLSRPIGVPYCYFPPNVPCKFYTCLTLVWHALR